MREMKIILLFLVLLLIAFQLDGVVPVKEIDRKNQISNFKELHVSLGLHKSVPKGLETEFYAALKYYPEFKDVKIKVKRKNIKTTMQCRPRFDYFLHKKKNRTYIIFVDNKKKDNNGVLFEELPFNAKVGVFGHELAHIVDYNTKNNFNIISMGIKYLNSNQRKAIEHHVDSLAIAKGLGYQINDFSKYVFEESDVSNDYLKYKKRFYFQPLQIRSIIANNPIYLNAE